MLAVVTHRNQGATIGVRTSAGSMRRWSSYSHGDERGKLSILSVMGKFWLFEVTTKIQNPEAPCIELIERKMRFSLCVCVCVCVCVFCIGRCSVFSFFHIFSSYFCEKNEALRTSVDPLSPPTFRCVARKHQANWVDSSSLVPVLTIQKMY